MDWTRLGLVIRALRRRKGWRQLDIARIAHVSQTLISLIERGHGDRVTGEVLRRVAAAVDARLVVDLRWRGGDVERLLDAGHAALVSEIAARLQKAGWEVLVEVTYETARAAGSIDILAWHAATSTLLAIEIKTEVTSAEATLRKLDEKVRIAADLAGIRYGWRARFVSKLLVLEATSTNRRRIDAHRVLFDGALPVRDDAVRQWLRRPSGAISGRLFASPSNPGAGIHVAGGRHRVRKAVKPPDGAKPRAAPHESPGARAPGGAGPTVLRG